MTEVAKKLEFVVHVRREAFKDFSLDVESWRVLGTEMS